MLRDYAVDPSKAPPVKLTTRDKKIFHPKLYLMTRLDEFASILDAASRRFLVLEYDHVQGDDVPLTSQILVGFVGKIRMKGGKPMLGISTWANGDETIHLRCIELEVHSIIVLFDLVKRVAIGKERKLSEHETKFLQGRLIFCTAC